MFLFIRFSGPKVHRSMARPRCSHGLVLHVFKLPKTQQIDQVISNQQTIIFKTFGILGSNMKTGPDLANPQIHDRMTTWLCFQEWIPESSPNEGHYEPRLFKLMLDW